MNTLSSMFLMAPPAGATPEQGTGQLVTTLLMFGAIFLIFWLLIIRPQNKRQKEQKAMLEALGKGDKVVSIGGIHGTITSLNETTVILKVDDNTTMEFSRSAISSVIQKKGQSGSKPADGNAQSGD